MISAYNIAVTKHKHHFEMAKILWEKALQKITLFTSHI